MSITPLEASAQHPASSAEPIANRIVIPIKLQQEIANPQSTQFEEIEQILSRKRDDQKVRYRPLITSKVAVLLWIIPGKQLVISRDNRFRALAPGVLNDKELNLVRVELKKLS